MSLHTLRDRRSLRAAPPIASDRRPDIQGLRTVAALLVAAYHLWTHRISGAVDVFFVVSAFVMTQSLLRELSRSGEIRLGKSYRDLLFRMAPLAWIVIGGTMLSALILLPITEWSTIAQQATAAGTFSINYYLGFESMTYLGEEANASLFQHFWAMAVQVQFYLFFPLIAILSTVIARRSGLSPATALGIAMTVVLVLSMGYASISVWQQQSFAYYDTAARAWEFAAGALLAIALPAIRLPRVLGLIAAGIGLALLVTFGMLVDVTELFPGPAALIPVGAAVLILVGGASGTGAGASRLLSARPLVKMADYSFGFYLWHWPVLTIYRQLSGATQLGMGDGIGVLLLAALLAYTSQRFLEGRVRDWARQARGWRAWRRPAAALAAMGLVPVILISGTTGYVGLVLTSTPTDNPGAAVLREADVSISPFAEIQPPLVGLGDTQWDEWGQQCEELTTESNETYHRCVAGDDGAPLRLVALGDSHTQIWLSAFADVIDRGLVHMTSYFRGACPLSTAGGDKIGETHVDASGCRDANLTRIALAVEELPHAVLTTVNIARDDSPEISITSGFVEAVELLTASSIPVVGVRDVPRFAVGFGSCLEENGMDPEPCTIAVDRVLDPTPFDDVLPEPLQQDPKFSSLDFSDLICFDGGCPAVIGGIIPYVDNNHLTRAYVKTMAPYVLEAFSTRASEMEIAVPDELRGRVR